MILRALLLAVILPQLAVKIFDEFGIAAAILMSVIGMVLHWRMPRHRMSVEERVKDGILTQEEGRRQIRFYQWCAPISTAIGIFVLLLVLFDLAG
jgi:hypothetical protein